MKFTQIALLSAATLAVAQRHNHARHHEHVARRGSPIEARGATYTTTVEPPTVTVYMLDGKPISSDDVKAGVASGKYFLVGDTVLEAPSSVAAPPPPPTSSAAQGGAFAEKPSPKPEPTTTKAPPPPPTTTAAAVAAPSVAAPSTGGGNGDTSADFPSGKIPCSSFPSKYGAIDADWLNLGGWTGIQHVPNYKPGDSSISYIEGKSGCNANTYCSYACPIGFQKTQWPDAQGATGQSIGGLYCNADGMLELSRPSVKQICEKGAGGVTVKNTLSKKVAICRTDYPGTESETIPTLVGAGETQPLTCPDSDTYYTWKGMKTTAQYYINPAGASVADACQWGTAGTNLGNWAPVNVGVGKHSTGTFIGIFPNAPTNPDGKLDFNVAIKGAVTAKCEYKNGQYYTDGNVTPTGCTTGTTGDVYFEFS
ncbi:Uncharacterized protein BP5553_07670 [Venustampulla echinocandica]|uniref:SUN-domain-containing protein n=1 Tax=Venustampulla echinocandica TaxID=2656787 RepID=A0A370TH69_9HELO|nr:Uncharacterized protein BP5553_07670 [Venustampulla echinocandica]RDL34542.1 Uncharacterized protein BP5553_07670 [Venustampulla echinocandica]